MAPIPSTTASPHIASGATIGATHGSASRKDVCPPAPKRPFSGLTKILWFFAVVTVLAFALHATINYGLTRIRTSKFGSLNNVMSGRVNADIIINGSSRALVHYDPRIIEEITGFSSYNIGMNSSQIDVQLAVLRTYLKRNSKPKWVIQNLEAFIFETTKVGEIYEPATFVPYLDEDELYRPLKEIDPAVWKWKHIPLYGYVVEDMKFTWVRGLLGAIGIDGAEDYFRGFNPRHLRWTEDFARFKAHVGDGLSYRIEPQGIKALTELIRTCKDAGIELLLVYSPEYFEMQALEKNRAEIFATLQRLAGEFQVPLWDYSHSPISRQRDYFYNSQHMNAQGAALFSTDFARRLQTLVDVNPRK